jgi:hypothetical protein
MREKPSSQEVPMSELNVAIPTELLERIKLAKVLTKTTIRQLAAEAFEAWLRQHGVTAERIAKLKAK